ILVVAGIGLIATQGDLSAFRRPGGQAGVRWGSATGGLIATYTVVDAYAVKTLGIVPVMLDWFSNLLRFFLLSPLVIADPRRALAALRGYWRFAIGVGLLSPLSDRKSTRLNSSHVEISYAVFCLKKKKKNDRHASQHVIVRGRSQR